MPVYDLREKFYETINGEEILFESDTIGENLATGHLLTLLGECVKKNKRGFIFPHLVTYFPDGNILIPDIMFIDAAKEQRVLESPEERFNVVPDMVAEILSKSTMNRDRTVKKDIYERNSVKEYWLVDSRRERIEVYLLRDGKYFLDDIYQNYSESELKELTDEERAEVKFEIPVAVLDGFKVKIKNIFGWYFD